MEAGVLKPKVALVFPPFGTNFTPSLGLGLLSAGVKGFGFDCRTFYWSLDLLSEMPGRNLDSRLSAYEFLSWAGSFPINEWIFSEGVFPQYEDAEGLVERYMAQVDRHFDRRHRPGSNGGGWLRAALHRRSRPSPLNIQASRLAQDLRQHAESYVADMAKRLGEYDIIGIATTFFQNMAALALAKKLKQQWPDKVIVLGGANCEGVMGQTQLEQFPFVDYVFSGEVDRSFPEFVRRYSENAAVDGIPGIIYRDEQRNVVVGPSAEPLQDLDALPIPDFDDFVAARDREGISGIRKLVVALESARGCWWGAKQHCTFCGLNALGMAFRQKSQDRFQWEVEEIQKRYGTRHFYITDNILSMSYFNEFVEWAKQSRTELNFFWEIKANMNRQQTASLAQAGINWLQPGIEHFSSDVLKIMKKGVKGIQNVAFLKYANENGLLVPYYVLYGFPGEKAEMYYAMEGNLRKLVHLEPPRAVGAINYERFNPYHQNPESFGFRLRPAVQYRAFYPFSEDVVSRLAYFFERDDSPKFPYVEGVKREVLRWQQAYERSATRKERSSLSWAEAGDDIVIDDCRSGFPRRRYRLVNHAVPVFRALDRPTTLDAVVKATETTEVQPSCDRAKRSTVNPLSSGLRRAWARTEEAISFTREEFAREPARCLERLVEAGVIYVEDDWYLALPVADGSRRASSTIRRWQTTTVGIEATRATPWWHI